MTTPLTLAVFGANGGTGQELVTQALAAGYHVRAVVRRPDAVKLDHPRLTVHVADVVDPDNLAEVMTGVEAVLSALGSRSGRGPTDVQSRGTGNIREAMTITGASRLVVISAIPVGPRNEKNLMERVAIHPTLGLFFGGSYDDARRMERDLVAADDIDWTAFRPPYLANGPATRQPRTAVNARLSGAWMIRRAELAAAMLAAIGDSQTFRRAINIAR